MTRLLARKGIPFKTSKWCLQAQLRRGVSQMEETATYRWQERRLGRTVLRTYRDNVDLDDVVPNPKQPRMGPKVDPELQRQIEANEGVFEPLLLEPHPDIPNKFRIIDGDRRWTNSKILVENQKKEEYRRSPSEGKKPNQKGGGGPRGRVYIHRHGGGWGVERKENKAQKHAGL